MSYSGIDSLRSVSATYGTLNISSSGRSSNIASDSTLGALTSGTGDAASVDISRPAQLFNKLKTLQTQDPEKYKKVLTEAANRLTDAAKSATGDDQKFLNDLAGKFTQAANGDVNALQPPQGPPPGGVGRFGSNLSDFTKEKLTVYGQNSSTQEGLLSVLSKSSSRKQGPNDTVHQTIKGVFDTLDQEISGSTTASSVQ